MSGLSNYLEGKLIDHIFRGVSYAAPTVLYASLHTADPADTGLHEISGGGYQRSLIYCAEISWNKAGNVVSNNVLISFPQSLTNWGTVTHFGLWDNSLGGNMLLSGQLAQAKVINQADVVSFPVSYLTATFD